MKIPIKWQRGDGDAPDEVKAFRRIFPQFLASIAQNLLIWDFGLTLAFPSIVVPSLMGVSTDLNPDETLLMTAEQTSWLASIIFVFQPIGSVLSGLITEPIGRKKAMLLVNIPHIVAWLMLSQANSLEITYAAFGLLGLGVGLMEAPIMTYISEICQPSLRGPLMSICGISATSGIFMVFLLGSFFSWRQVASICAIIPSTTLLAVFFIPETPIWLLSKNRPKDAERSLMWLRGWVSPKAVSAELSQLQKHSELSRSCVSCEKLAVKCGHPAPTLCDKFRDMTRKRTLKPFSLVTIMFIAMQFSCMFAMRPYIVQVLRAHGIPLGANATTVILGLLGILANIVLLLIIRICGKRNIYLYTMVVTTLSCFGLSIYGFKFFPSGWSSYDSNTNITSRSNAEFIEETVGNWSYFALAMFLIMQFSISLGGSSIPNIMMSEIFPFKSRSFYCGIVAAENQLLAFFATKTYYDLEAWLSLPGVILFYGMLGAISCALMYWMLPETENRSLEDIELHFSDNSRSMTDINIRINSHTDVESSTAQNVKQRF